MANLFAGGQSAEYINGPALAPALAPAVPIPLIILIVPIAHLPRRSGVEVTKVSELRRRKSATGATKSEGKEGGGGLRNSLPGANFRMRAHFARQNPLGSVLNVQHLHLIYHNFHRSWELPII